MAVTLKQIALGSLSASSNFTTGDVGASKVQVVRSIRLVNTHASNSITVNISAGPTSGEKAVAPKDLSLGPGQAFVDDTEIVLKANDHLKVEAGSGGGPVHYVVSGFERDQS